MHELSIAQEIINIVQNEITVRNLNGVAEINLRLGALSGVDPEALSFSFEAATIDSPLSETRLVINQVPVKCKCRLCGKDFIVDDVIFLCPHCDLMDVEIVQGEELDIEYLIEK